MATKLDAVIEQAAPDQDYSAALLNKVPDLVKGAGFIGTGANGAGTQATTDPAEIADRSVALARAITKSVKNAHANPDAAKGVMSPAFASQFPGFSMGFSQWQAQAANESILNELSKQVLGKAITSTSPLSSGFVPYDLLAPTKLIYPFYTVLRNKIGRTPAQGKQRELKLITSVSGSHSGGAGQFSDITTSELTNFGTYPGVGAALNVGAQTSQDVEIPYKQMIQTEGLSWLAQFEGQGFDDIAALINLILVQEFTANEEGQMLFATGTVLNAPTISAALRVAGSNETALNLTNGHTVNVYATACNDFGESVASSVSSVTFATGDVIDVTITTPSPGAAFYNIYVGDGTTTAADVYQVNGSTAAAGVASAAPNAGGAVGGTKWTFQGTMPTAGKSLATATLTGSGASTRYEGFLSVLSGWAVTNSVYPAGWQGASNQSVGDVLSTAVVVPTLETMWDGSNGYRADPTEIISSGRDLANLSNDMLTNAHNQAYSLRVQQTEVDSLIAGGAVSTLVNPITRSKIGLTVHPFLPQGTALIMSYTVPHPNANVGQTFENAFVQDLMSIKWPVADMSFRFSIFALGALVAQAPQYCGLLQGLQNSATTPYS